MDVDQHCSKFISIVMILVLLLTLTLNHLDLMLTLILWSLSQLSLDCNTDVDATEQLNPLTRDQLAKGTFSSHFKNVILSFTIMRYWVTHPHNSF